MKRLYLLLSLMTALLLSPADVLAWGGVAVRGNFTGSWTDVYYQEMSFGSGVAKEFDVNASSWAAGTYEFGIKLLYDTPSSGSKWFAGGATVTLGTETAMNTSAGNSRLVHNTTYKSYHFSVTAIDGDNIKVTITGSTAPAVDNNAYYFYSEELLIGLGMSLSDWKSDVFKFAPLRWRTMDVDASKKGQYDYEYQTWSMKDDLMKKAGVTSINYVVKKGDGSIVYRPWPASGNYELGTNSVQEYNEAVQAETYENTAGATGTGTFKLNKGTAKSYNFCITTSGNRPITIQKNGDLSRIDTEHASNNKEFYLIGNLLNANQGAAWNPTDAQYRWKMDRHIYKDGKVVTDEAGCDSVVYSVTVNRPANGWGYLYLGVMPKYLVEDNSFTDWDWGHILRPQIHYPQRPNHDGTATEGCLSMANLDDNKYTASDMVNDALNPVVSDDIESYTFTMNYTTSTYRLVFNKKFYIVGPGVNGTTDDWTANAVEFPYNADKGCWETEVTLYNGKPFRFAMDKKMTNCFGENSFAPAAPNSAGEAGMATNSTDWETQYCNKVQWYNEGTEDHTEAMSGNDIINYLPTGNYTIRFYAKADNDDTPSSDQSRVYYTIDPTFTFRTAGSATSQTTILNPLAANYTYYTTYSYYHAMKKPENVKAFVISNVEDNGTEAKAIKQEVSVQTSADELAELYANEGLILALSNIGYAGTTANVTFEFADNPFSTDAYILPVGRNLLRPSLESEHLEKQNDYGYCYIFGYKKLNVTDTGVTLGFWKPGSGNTAYHSAYLSWTEDVTYPANGLVIDFDDVVGTGINATEVETAESKEYYNMQGMRVIPTQKGIYIHNGKKVIIK